MSNLDPKSLVLGWRSEFAAELEAVQKTLPPLQAAIDAAADKVSAASAEYQSVIKLLLKPVHTQNGTRYESTESLINMRLDELRSKIDEAKSRLARAKADLDVARTKADYLKAAIRQIDRAVPSETEEAA